MEEIQIECRNGKIRIHWRWCSKDTEYATIFYKEKSGRGGAGAPFHEHKIYRTASDDRGEAERALESERGLYTFTFVINGEEEGKREIVYDDVMLGEAFYIRTEWRGHEEGTVVVFSEVEREVPSGVMEYTAGKYRHRLPYPIRQGCCLLVPGVYRQEEIKFRLSEPYDKAYILQ